MIPKKIHYIWFGGKKMPAVIQRCVASWYRYCPDYEITLWTEQNYDVTKIPYMKEAWEAKKWAFASDVARLDILYHEGGFYLDTDVELIRSLDSLRQYPCFFAEDGGGINTGLGFGADKENEVVKQLLQEYTGRHFRNPDSTFDLTPCTIPNSRMFLQNGYVPGKKEIQMIQNAVILPKEYFDPIDGPTSRLLKTPETIGIHHRTATWESPTVRLKSFIRNQIGTDRCARLKKILRTGHLYK